MSRRKPREYNVFVRTRDFGPLLVGEAVETEEHTINITLTVEILKEAKLTLEPK